MKIKTKGVKYSKSWTRKDQYEMEQRRAEFDQRLSNNAENMFYALQDMLYATRGFDEFEAEHAAILVLIDRIENGW